MGRLITPRPDDRKLDPGEAVVWSVDRGGNIVEQKFCQRDEGIKILQNIINNPHPAVRRAVFNYKAVDGESLDAIRVEFAHYPKQKTLWEALPWWLGGVT